MMKLGRLLLFAILVCVAKESLANCTRVTSTSLLSADAISAGYTAADWIGATDTGNSKNIGLPAVISLSSGTFQPSGTLLASSTLNFVSQGAASAYSANQILFRCDIADKNSLYEMYATNGDNDYTGRYANDEVEGAYYSYVKNVAVRLTNTKTGEYYSRYWKSRQITSDSYYSDNKYIYIPASAFSDVIFELYRIDSTTRYADSSNVYSYNYSQPNGYIAFKGPGLDTNYITDGSDSNSVWWGFYSLWPASWSLYNTGTKFVRGAICEVEDYPNNVLIPKISSAELRDGRTTQANFSVRIECESGAISSTQPSTNSSSNVSMGFLVNQSTAVNAAQALGLVTSSGGLTWLLDNNYGTAPAASGVGIRIYNSAGQAINLLPNLSSTGTGNGRGWYAFKDLTSLVSSGTTDIYAGDFVASLEAISGQTITVGSVNAQLQVVVSFQ